MTTILVLFVLGLLMLLLETVLPGGVLGVLGGCAMLGGTVLAYMNYGPGGGTVALLIAVALVVGGVVLEFVVLPRTRIGRRFFLHSAVTGVSSAPADVQAVVGRECEALTVLAPSGVVLLDGKKHEAFCRDGYSDRGARLVVRGSDNFRLIVSKP